MEKVKWCINHIFVLLKIQFFFMFIQSNIVDRNKKKKQPTNQPK